MNLTDQNNLISIHCDLTANEILLTVLLNNNIIHNATLSLTSGTISATYLKCWLHAEAKESIYAHFPVLDIQAQLAPNIIDNQLTHGVLVDFITTIKNTNAVIVNNKKLYQLASGFKNYLVYNPNDNELFKIIYHHLQTHCPDTVYYQTFSTGWNKVTRQQETATYFDPLDLIDLIKKQEIKKIISMNMYYLENLLITNKIYLPAILDFMQVEYICFDMDWYEFSGAHAQIGRAHV